MHFSSWGKLPGTVIQFYTVLVPDQVIVQREWAAGSAGLGLINMLLLFFLTWIFNPPALVLTTNLISPEGETALILLLSYHLYSCPPLQALLLFYYLNHIPIPPKKFPLPKRIPFLTVTFSTPSSKPPPFSQVGRNLGLTPGLFNFFWV